MGGIKRSTKHDIIIAVEDTEIDDAAHLKNYLIERTTPGQRVGDCELPFRSGASKRPLEYIARPRLQKILPHLVDLS